MTLLLNRTGRAVAVVEFLSTLLSPVVGGENLGNFSREHEMKVFAILCNQKLVAVTDSLEDAKKSLAITHSKGGDLVYSDPITLDTGFARFPNTISVYDASVSQIDGHYYYIVPIETSNYPQHL